MLGQGRDPMRCFFGAWKGGMGARLLLRLLRRFEVALPPPGAAGTSDFFRRGPSVWTSVPLQRMVNKGGAAS